MSPRERLCSGHVRFPPGAIIEVRFDRFDRNKIMLVMP